MEKVFMSTFLIRSGRRADFFICAVCEFYFKLL